MHNCGLPAGCAAPVLRLQRGPGQVQLPVLLSVLLLLQPASAAPLPAVPPALQPVCTKSKVMTPGPGDARQRQSQEQHSMC